MPHYIYRYTEYEQLYMYVKHKKNNIKKTLAEIHACKSIFKYKIKINK